MKNFTKNLIMTMTESYKRAKEVAKDYNHKIVDVVKSGRPTRDIFGRLDDVFNEMSDEEGMLISIYMNLPNDLKRKSLGCDFDPSEVDVEELIEGCLKNVELKRDFENGITLFNYMFDGLIDNEDSIHGLYGECIEYIIFKHIQRKERNFYGEDPFDYEMFTNTFKEGHILIRCEGDNLQFETYGIDYKEMSERLFRDKGMYYLFDFKNKQKFCVYIDNEYKGEFVDLLFLMYKEDIVEESYGHLAIGTLLKE